MSREGTLSGDLPVGAREEARRVLDRTIDAAIAERVRLHGDRREKTISVEEYKAGLSAARHVEDVLEPMRRELGATRARRFELDGDPAAGAGAAAGARLARRSAAMTAPVERRIVLLALEDARSHRIDGYKWPEKVAAATPQHMGRTATGRPQPMGERKVRRILNELVADGCAERTRSHFGGHAWRITDKGRIERGERRGNATV